MKKKSTEVRKAVEELNEKLNETRAILAEAEAEDLQRTTSLSNKIQGLCDEENAFCGAILTPNEIAQIVHLALSKRENVIIPFKIYLKD